MTIAETLSAAVQAQLESITVANGYNTDLGRVYGFGEAKPDKAPFPCLLVSVPEDRLESFVGTTGLRSITYRIEGMFSRAASLQDLQRLHHDVLKSLGIGKLPMSRPLPNGWPFEESAVFEPDQNGSTSRTFVSTLTLQYVEKY